MTRFWSVFSLVLITLFAASALQADQATSPYAGQENRAIKALSAKEIQDLRKGAGMGFAKAAELNGYPGPIHVLELADRLGLTPAQAKQTKSLYQDMKQKAVTLGKQIIAAERALDTRFAGDQIDEATLRTDVSAIARLRGELRAHHLRYHLQMKRLLTPHQVAAYDRLRGYTASGPSGGTHDRHNH